MFVKAAPVSVLILLAACMQAVHAVMQVLPGGCKALNRDISFEDSVIGPYSEADLKRDFDGYRYFKRPEMASIVDIGGAKYLDVKLAKGCRGTTGTTGCGLEGALPLFGVGDSATLEYTVRFSDGYDFKKGGKLMGLCSGNCKDGCQVSADQGASIRAMWGPGGSFYLYTYTYSGSTKTCGMNTKPATPVAFKAGQDYRIRITIKMNTPGQANGVASIYIDGAHIVTATGLVMRSSATQVIDSMVFHTFFGGSTMDWAASKDEHIYFKNIKIYDGDCGGSNGVALALAQAPKWEPTAAGVPAGVRPLALKTSIYGTWNGRFCLWYEVTNDATTPCNRFILQTNVNPTFGKMSSYKNLKVLESDDTSGYYAFTRDLDKHAFLKPGKTRSGNVCLANPINIYQTAQSIQGNYQFSAYCEN